MCIECGLKSRVQPAQHRVRRRCDCCFLRGVRRHILHADQIRLMGPVYRIHSVIDRGVHDREAARGVNGSRLRARRADDRQQSFVPLNYRIDRCGCGFGAGGYAQPRKWTDTQKRKQSPEMRHVDSPSDVTEGGRARRSPRFSYASRSPPRAIYSHMRAGAGGPHDRLLLRSPSSSPAFPVRQFGREPSRRR